MCKCKKTNRKLNKSIDLNSREEIPGLTRLENKDQPSTSRTPQSK